MVRGSRATKILAVATCFVCTALSQTEIVPDANTIILDHFNSVPNGVVHGVIPTEKSISSLNFAADLKTGSWVRYSADADTSNQLSQQGTLELWLKPRQFDAGIVNINWGQAESYPVAGHVLHLMLNAEGKITIGGWPPACNFDPGIRGFVGNTSVPLNQWSHIAISWGAKTRIYINGVLDFNSDVCFRPAVNRTWVYLNYWGAGELGLVDELHLSKVERSIEEIQRHACLTCAPQRVTLSPVTSPSYGQPGTIVVTLTGTGFPSGTISAANTLIKLEPNPPSSGPNAEISATAVQSLLGSTRRVSFVVPASLTFTSPQSYLASLSGATSTGAGFASLNKATLTINPPAKLLTVTPNSGDTGKSITVALTAQYTNFVNGSTQVSFGPGISVGGAPAGEPGPVTVMSPTQATAQIAIAPVATAGPRDVSVRTGAQTATLAAGFTVTESPSVPIISSITPGSGKQGLTNQVITLTGQSTHFLQGASSLALGPGIVVHSVSVVSPIRLTALISIGLTASPGQRTVTVSTSSETVELVDGFQVVPLCNIGIPATRAYITTFNNDRVSGLDTTTNQVLATIPVGARPHSARLTPDGRHLLVTNFSAIPGTLDVIDTFTNFRVRRIEVGPGPTGIELNRDGSKAYVANRTSNTVSVINLLTMSVEDTLATQGSGAHWLTLSQDETKLYVANLSSPVSVINLQSKAVTQIPVANAIYSALNRSRSEVWFSQDNQYSIVSTLTGQLVGVVRVGSNLNEGIVFSPDDTTAFADLSSVDQVAVIDVATRTVTKLVGVGDGPNQIDLTPDGRYAYVPAANSQQTNVIDTTAGALMLTIPMFGQPLGVDVGVACVDPGPVVNQAPRVEAGPDLSIEFGGIASLRGDASDDGLPVGGAFTFSWSKASGPGNVSFANPASAATTASFTASGTYVLRLTAGDSLLSSSDEVTVTVRSANVPSILSVLPNAGLQGTIGLTVTLAGQFTHFAQGVATVSFGAGISVNAVTVASATSLTAQVTIDSNAAAGPRTVTVTTGTEVVTLTNGFSILQGNRPPIATDDSLVLDLHGDDGGKSVIDPAFQIERFANIESPGAIALPPIVSPFGNYLYVSSLRGGLTGMGDSTTIADPISRLDLTNRAVSTFFVLPAESDVGYMVFGPGAPFTSNLYISSNNRDGGQPGDFGGSIVFLEPDPQLKGEQFLTKVPPPADLSEPAAIAFGPGGAFGTDLFVMNLTDTPGDIAKISPAGVRSTFISSPRSGYGLFNGGSIAFGIGGAFGTDLFLFENPNLITRIDASGHGSPFTALPGAVEVESIAFAPQGAFGSYLYATARMPNNTSSIFRVTANGQVEEFANSFSQYWLNLAFSKDGSYLYVSHLLGNTVYRIKPNPKASLNVLSNDVDPDGNPLTAVLVSSPANGKVKLGADGSFYYTPNPGFLGDDSFTYRANDGKADSNTAKVTITVTRTNQAPLVTAGFDQTVAVQSSVDLRGLATDDGLPFGSSIGVSWSKVRGPGTVTFANVNALYTTASFSAAGTYVLRLTATDSASESSSEVKMVVTSSAAVTHIWPNSALQGQSNVSVAITGLGTHFVGGGTQVGFGAGVIVNSVAISGATSLTANISIAPGAAIGLRTVTVTTGTEVASLVDGFSVTPSTPTPILLSASPNSGPQGGSGPVVISGQFTHFVQGASSVSFGAGITVNSVIVSSATSLTAQVSVDPNATVGPRTVTVTTGSEVVSLPGGFSVTAGTPILMSVFPANGKQGQGVSVAMVGQSTNFVQETTTANFGAGITVDSVTVTDGQHLTAQISIAPEASIGTRTVTITTNSEVASASNAFTVQAGTPVLLSVTPNSGLQGQANLSVAVIGQFTHFVQGTTQVSFGSGITVNSVSIGSPTTLMANISIAAGAAVGARTVTVTTGAETVSTNAFTVQGGTIILTQVLPASGQQGHAFIVNVTGQFTNFVQGTSQVSLGAGITVGTVSVLSSTNLTADIVIAANAALGMRTATVTTGTEVVALANAFTVTAGSPALLTVNPNTGQQGQTNLNVTLTGAFTNWVQGTTSISFGAGITVNSVTVGSATALTANCSIAGGAAIGSRAVTVTTGTEVVTLADSFSVAAGTPVLLSLNPNSGQQGQTNLSLVITGQFTHFAQGTSTVSLGAGITVNSVTVSNATSLTANVNIAGGAAPGTRTATVTTGTEVVSLASAFTVNAVANQAPTITIAPTWSITLPNRLTINYTVTDDGKPLGGALTVSWEKISGPAEHGFSDQTLTSISVGFGEPGTYVLRITATDTEFTVARDITVTVSGTPMDPPTASITTPTEGQDVTTQVNVVGTANSAALTSWTLEYRHIDESIFRPFATGTSAVVNGTLGVFDPTLVLNGIVLIRLKATDNAGQTTTSAERGIVLTKNQKLGHFTVSFQDLNVPVAGLGIQLIRTYDSRNASIGDFGSGWTLDIRNVRLRDNGQMGLNWQGTSTGGAFPTYCIQPTKAHLVTVVLADGTTYKFQPTISPQCQSLVPIESAQINFVQVSGPKATMSLAGSKNVVIFDAWPGPLDLLDENTFLPVDYDNYQLTLPDGRVLAISRPFGLQTLTDTNANKLTISASGIMHSSGKGITFLRDGFGRITQVTDPNGKVLKYSYDASSDLVSFTDRENLTTTFTYDANHRLLKIIDPRGVEPIRNEYDAAGRLIKHLDAFGNPNNYTHDFANHQEIVTDRLGNPTVNEYDAEGNVVKVTDALGGITRREYDANGNMTKEIDALGHVRSFTYDANDNRLTETDPLTNTTTYTYTALNRVATITDPLGRVSTNTYDAKGNLTKTRDALGQETTYTYNGQGLQTSMTNPLGQTTSFGYDGNGNLISQTDPTGKVTTYTYDANGNRKTESRTRTGSGGSEVLLTQYSYNGENRLISTTFPDGATTQVQYNSIGKQSVTIDQLSRQTSYVYDNMGRLVETTFPDGTKEKSEYDAEGRRTKSFDRANRATTYEYDKLGRLIKTIFPDLKFTTTTYNAIGQVTQSTDARGNITSYEYDATGRRTKVTNALNQATTFVFDKAGNQTSMTDAKMNTTQFEYDPLNRRTRVIHPNASADVTAYDALGRTTSKTDQAGRTTQFQYDALGRLIQVIDALSQVTRYTYDEVGNRLTQIDASNRTTSFEYDKLGRRTKRILPLGMFETMKYDAAGNLTERIDFNGRKTTYQHDQMNRLTQKTPDPFFASPPVTFSYSATGQRSLMTDPSGTTTYFYDNRERLISKATPQGTLQYTYDSAGNLTTIRSSNSGGASVDYTYDQLNRLSTAKDNRLAQGTTTYAYDAAGNLDNYLYPNGLHHKYTYNTLNRLTDLTLTRNAITQASYAYTLGPSGNRTKIVEFGGRTVDYTYDALYRLTQEMISGSADPTKNGTVGYQYDPVGNRLQRTSTITVIPPQTFTYDANDRLNSDTYDNNGNTTGSGGSTFSFDFENRLQTKDSTGVVIVYDGDGNRVSKTVGGTTTRYLVDDRNLTGYAQVLEEISSGTVQRVYTYGLNRIGQSQASGTSFYGYDGHGSVRLLSDTLGVVTDRYEYDAYGNVINSAGSTPNVYHYSGEQLDASIGSYYLRARHYRQDYGRFVTVDPHPGHLTDPTSLHRYLYARVDPVNKQDPSGEQYTLVELAVSLGIQASLRSVQLSYYKNLFKFGASAIGCIYCLINPGNELQARAMDLVFDPTYGQEAEAFYSQGRQLAWKGYQELAKAAGRAYTGTFFDPILKNLTLTMQSARIAVHSELLLYQHLLTNPRFILYEQGIISASMVTVAREETVVKIAKLKKLYDTAGRVGRVVDAYTSGEQGEKCYSIWSLFAGSIPWGSTLPE